MKLENFGNQQKRDELARDLKEMRNSGAKGKNLAKEVMVDYQKARDLKMKAWSEKYDIKDKTANEKSKIEKVNSVVIEEKPKPPQPLSNLNTMREPIDQLKSLEYSVINSGNIDSLLSIKNKVNEIDEQIKIQKDQKEIDRLLDNRNAVMLDLAGKNYLVDTKQDKIALGNELFKKIDKVVERMKDRERMRSPIKNEDINKESKEESLEDTQKGW